ncbi:MAG TPA: hypothetical protein VGJ37_08615 [Pyrinomonadaceae bacterium]
MVSNPSLFPAVFVLNAWLLGYHHVVSTFTRLTFDSGSFKRHRFLVTWLPLIVLAAAVVACAFLGTWILTTVYLYWQWWHYTRQSYGVSRIYQRKAGLEARSTLRASPWSAGTRHRFGQSADQSAHSKEAPRSNFTSTADDDLLHKLVIYALPVWGILYRSWQAPEQFLFTEVRVIPVPLWLVAAAGSVTLLAIAWWVVQTIRNWFAGTLSVAHSLYLCSHLLIFGIGYLAISNINQGWLVVTVWHNCQYILTVWMFNNNRFKEAVDPKHRFLSFISQRRRVFTYLGVCLLLSTAIYSALQYSLSWIAIATASSLPLFAIVFQAINFHHYVVDAIIWRRAAVSSQASID